jgi:hypothetical protein
MSGQRWGIPLLALALMIAAAGAIVLWLPRLGTSGGAVLCANNGSALRRVELVFGLSRKGRSDVSETEWSDFLAREITPRFPDGLTVLAANGQWRGPGGTIVREPARLLLVWTPPAPDLDGKIEHIRAAWKREQQQDSVLRAIGTDCVSF